MGGRVFHDQGIETVRIPAPEALALSQQVLTALHDLERSVSTPVQPSRLVPAYRSKADYGDLDIVVSDLLITQLGDEFIRAGLADRIGTPLIKHRAHVNDPTLALALHVPNFGMFQIDLITAKDSAIDYTLGYFSWNDTGSYIGRIARQMGLRFGQGGLSVLLAHNDGTRVQISTDRDRTLEFLGFDSSAHRAGFDRPEDIYDFIAKSRYFDPAIYEMDRMTNRARSRIRKRPFYQPFIEAMRKRPARHHWPEVCSPTDIAAWRERVFDAFPGAENAHAAAIKEKARTSAARTFFSGQRVTALTGVKGEPLKHLMNAVRGQFTSSDEFLKWTERGDEDDLAARLQRAIPSIKELA